ncbi:22171_t:CDS:2, partial [Gigaspora rosea]
MEILCRCRDIFRENEEGAQSVLQEVYHNVSTKDHVVATWLDTNNANIICVIRQALDTFDWIEHKKASNKSLSKAEIEFTEIFNKNEAKYAYLQDTKELLLLSECGTVDYGTHELKERLSKNKRVKNLTEESMKAEIKRAKNNTMGGPINFLAGSPEINFPVLSNKGESSMQDIREAPAVITKETTQEPAKEVKDERAEVEVQMSIRPTEKELSNEQEGKIGAPAAGAVYEESDMQGIQEAALSNKTETKQNSVQGNGGKKYGNNTRLGPDKQQSRFHERLSAQTNKENQTQHSFSFNTKRREMYRPEGDKTQKNR